MTFNISMYFSHLNNRQSFSQGYIKSQVLIMLKSVNQGIVALTKVANFAA